MKKEIRSVTLPIDYRGIRFVVADCYRDKLQ